MTIQEFLEWLDGNGLVIVDNELLQETLSHSGISPLDKLFVKIHEDIVSVEIW